MDIQQNQIWLHRVLTLNGPTTFYSLSKMCTWMSVLDLIVTLDDMVKTKIVHIDSDHPNPLYQLNPAKRVIRTKKDGLRDSPLDLSKKEPIRYKNFGEVMNLIGLLETFSAGRVYTLHRNLDLKPVMTRHMIQGFIDEGLKKGYITEAGEKLHYGIPYKVYKIASFPYGDTNAAR